MLVKDKYGGRANDPRLESDITRFKNGEPLDYVIGWVPFLGAHIDLKEKPLIPRTETEYWTEQALKEIPVNSRVKVLDIFSGSGCIGISVAVNRPFCQVLMADKNEKFVSQIQENIKINNLETQTSVVASDIFSNIKGKYDYIFANPPYIDKKDKSVKEEVKKYEPKEALYAPKNGFHFIEQTIKLAPLFLKDKGILFIEIDPRQSYKTKNATKNSPYKNADVMKDQYDRERYARLQI